MLNEREFLSDYLLINLLDQMWIQEVYEPHLNDLVTAFTTEIRICHDMERMDELMTKRPVLVEVFKLIKATNAN